MHVNRIGPRSPGLKIDCDRVVSGPESGGGLTLLGIEIGGTKRVLAVGDHNSGPIARERRPMCCSGNWEADLDGIVDEARSLLRRVEAAGQGPLEAIGVAVPGPVERRTGVLRNPPNLRGWRDVPLAARLTAAFGVPVQVENDANAAALAEHRFGAGRGTSDMVFLTMSTGVGGGILSGGRLVTGARGFAGELGHVAVVPNGRRCFCGLRGCLEAYCGGQALTKWLRRNTPSSSRIFERAAGERARIGPERLLEALADGDPFAAEVFSAWLDRLAIGIAAIVMAFDPERIVLGTIAVAAGEAHCFVPLRERVAARLWPAQRESLSIVPGLLGETLPEHAALAVAATVGSETRT
jgi:glucokinase